MDSVGPGYRRVERISSEELFNVRTYGPYARFYLSA